MTKKSVDWDVKHQIKQKQNLRAHEILVLIAYV